MTGSPGREGTDHRPELAPPVRQLVLGAGRMVGVEMPAHQTVLLHELETLGEDVGREAGQAGLEIAEAAGSAQEIAPHEGGPAIAPHFEGLGHPAALPADPPHDLRLERDSPASE